MHRNTYVSRNDFHKSWLSSLLHVAWAAIGILYWKCLEKCVSLDLVQLAAAEDSWWDFWYVGFIGAQRLSCKNWPWWLWAVTSRIFWVGLAWEICTFWNSSWVWRPLQEETDDRSFQTQQMGYKQLLRVATHGTGVWLAPYQPCMVTCFIDFSDAVCEHSTRAFILALAVNLAVKLL